MRTATALATPPPVTLWSASDEPPDPQATLPFPGIAPVLPVPVEHGDLGPLRHRCARFVQALVEVLAGDRPPRQMAAWMSPEVYEALSRRLVLGQRQPRTGRGHARLKSVHVFMVDDEVAEVAARMVHRGRSRAIAVRLEPQPTHRGEMVWRCTALEWA